MILALDAPDPIVAGIFFLVAAVLFILAFFGVTSRYHLIAGGLALCAIIWAWQQFALA